VISEQTLFRLDDPGLYNFRILDRVKVKGRAESVSVFEVYDGDEPDQFQLKAETRSHFKRGIRAYLERNFRGAQEHFAQVIEQNAKNKAALIYLQRSQFNASHGVPPDWDGVAQMEMK